MHGDTDGPRPTAAASDHRDRSACDSQGLGGVTRSREDLRYFQERAEQELRRAELADQPEAARAHALLAGYYLDLVHSCPEASPDPSKPRGES